MVTTKVFHSKLDTDKVYENFYIKNICRSREVVTGKELKNKPVTDTRVPTSCSGISGSEQ